MSDLLRRLKSQEIISPPSFLVDNTHYTTIMGSVAYGVSGESSDVDIYGFCIPPKEMIFPHLRGEIMGFGKQVNRFEQWQQHHVQDPSNDNQYDFQIYNIVKYFQLCMENNPNMIDSIFTPQRCITHCTRVGNIVRENRHMFLHKGAWHKFKGYAYSQMHKMDTKDPTGKRKEMIDKYGYDVKFAYHVVRLLNEVEQILVERNREQLKSIRRGEWTMDQIKEYFNKKESELETLYMASKIPYKPDEQKIKALLLQCLEEHYGSLDKIVVNVDKYLQAVNDIRKIVEGL